jgi:hypothetical protein
MKARFRCKNCGAKDVTVGVRSGVPKARNHSFAPLALNPEMPAKLRNRPADNWRAAAAAAVVAKNARLFIVTSLTLRNNQEI